MTNKPKKWILVGVGVLLAVFIGLALTWIIAPSMNSSSLTSASTTNSRPIISGISCDSMEHFINGNPYPIPAEIGIVPNQCIYWMHTHDNTGIIHIESPKDRDFTLGEFFDIWGEKFDNNQIFNNVVGKGGSNNNTLSVYINGDKVSNLTDYKEIKINAHDEIVIVYGTPPDSIPSGYQFPKGL
jgi:hypothetical protein